MSVKSTEAQLRARKTYYDKNRDDLCKKQCEYYKIHQETIKEKRRLRYQAKKAKDLLENPIPKVRKPRRKKNSNPPNGTLEVK